MSKVARWFSAMSVKTELNIIIILQIADWVCFINVQFNESFPCQRTFVDVTKTVWECLELSPGSMEQDDSRQNTKPYNISGYSRQGYQIQGCLKEEYKLYGLVVYTVGFHKNTV